MVRRWRLLLHSLWYPCLEQGSPEVLIYCSFYLLFTFFFLFLGLLFSLLQEEVEGRQDQGMTSVTVDVAFVASSFAFAFSL